MSTNDVTQLRELTDAMRDLERTLNTDIARELQAIAGALNPGFPYFQIRPGDRPHKR